MNFVDDGDELGDTRKYLKSLIKARNLEISKQLNRVLGFVESKSSTNSVYLTLDQLVEVVASLDILPGSRDLIS
jgi:hypothetical protein